MTADRNANERTSRVLKVLDELSARRPGAVVSGVHAKQSMDETHAVTGKWPALMGVEYCSCSGTIAVETAEETIDWRKLNPDIISHAHAGGLVRILTHFHNPCNEKYGGLRDDAADIDAILAEGTPQRGRWLAMLDEVAQGFKDLENQGVSVIYGPLHEHNCSGFWWGLVNKSPKMTPEKFKALWRDIFSVICERHGCHNVLWLWPPLGMDPVTMEAYPGDEYVDLVGLDIYGPLLRPHVDNYRRVVATGKPFVLSEFGGNGYPLLEENQHKYDCRILLDEITQHMPATRAFMFWTGDYSPAQNLHAGEMMHDLRVIDREGINCALRDCRHATLWYDKPAISWEKEALPIGNGRLGAMIFGGVEQEHIQFNESSLWIGDEKDTGAYQAFGDVFIDLVGPANATTTNYRRELDISRAVHAVTYTRGGVHFRREYFASHPANVMVFRFTADQAGSYSGSVLLTDMHQGKVVAEGNQLFSSGSLAGYKYEEEGPNYSIALDYEAQVLVLNEGGSVTNQDGRIAFDHVNSVTIIVNAGTDYVNDHRRGWRGEHPDARITAQLQAAAATSFQQLLADHVSDYRKLFDRVTLTLGDSLNKLPTDQRLTKYSQAAREPGLEALVFQYGRYLMIASSRDALPANLQGLWNNSIRPPWRCDYHTDINVQMNYWMADQANLGESFMPYANWLNSIREVRKAETNKAFTTRGWTMHGENGVFGGSTWQWVESGSAWCMQNLWDHYAFTQDKEFLRILAYPMMKEVCEFWQDRLKALPDGRLVAPNGFSPEHGPREDGVSHDQQLIWDVFTNTMAAADALGVDREFRNALAAKRDKLLAPTIGKWGQLQEWMVDRDAPTDDHRHLSHLVAVHPGSQITFQKTPELVEAAWVSLNARGDVSTGWSTAWKINLWARLHDGERAYKLMGNLLRLVGDSQMNYQNGGGLYANLFDAHPPFQIDGNFGYSAGVCEMLLQSHAGEIELLPALPKAWPNGAVTGLRARGNLEVDIQWQDGKLVKATLYPHQNSSFKVRCGEEVVELKLTAGKTTSVNARSMVPAAQHSEVTADT